MRQLRVIPPTGLLWRVEQDVSAPALQNVLISFSAEGWEIFDILPNNLAFEIHTPVGNVLKKSWAPLFTVVMRKFKNG
jgi:hypothetical protein